MARSQILMLKYLFRTSIVLFVILTSAINPVSLNPVAESAISQTESSATSQEGEQVWKFLLENFSTSKRYLTGEDLGKLVGRFQHCHSHSENNEENNNVGENNQGASQQFKSVKSFCDGKVCNKSDSDIVSVNAANNEIISDSYIELLKLSPPCKSPPWRLRHDNYNSLRSVNDICHQVLYHIANPECCRTPEKSSSVIAKDDLRQSDFDNEDESFSKKREKPSSGEVWGYGLLFVTIISLCSLAGVSVLPFMEKDVYKNILIVMVGLAVGSLTGSAVFHLLPQAFGMSDHDPDHDYLFISLVVCGGIWLFFMIERILNFIMDFKQRKDNRAGRSKMSSILSSTPENSTISMLVDNGSTKGVLRDMDDGMNTTICSQSDTGVIYECQEQAIRSQFGHQEMNPRLSSCHEHQVTFEQGKDSVIATVAWMIIFGDGLHNFIDGLSIGAAFNESILTGMSISVAVLCEELPHELGDFAILLNAGMSIRQALTYNFFSALTCYLGLAAGIFLGEIEASIYIFAVAGGMFLYIALVDMVPEMNEIAKETSKISVKKGMKVLFLQNLGLITGISVLFILAKYQDSIQF